MKQSKSEFWSGVEYDAQYAHLYSAEIAYLEGVLAEKQATSLLDVCCGTGIVTYPLAKRVHTAIGLDFSSPMISHAKSKQIESDGLQFIESDATTFKFGRAFDVVIMTGNAMQAFLTDESLNAVLSNIHSHMHHGSVFVFDIRLPSAENLEISGDYQHWGSYVSPMKGCVQVYGKDVEHPTQTETMLHYVRRVYPDKSVYESQIELRYRSLGLIEKCLAQHGLELSKLYSDWQKSPFSSQSDSLIAEVKIRN